MVDYDPEHRIERILDTILPSIMKVPDKEWQLRMLDKNELIANELNSQCDFLFADLPQVFMDLRHEVEARL